MTDYSADFGLCYGVLPDETVHLVAFAQSRGLCDRPVSYVLFGETTRDHMCPECLRQAELLKGRG